MPALLRYADVLESLNNEGHRNATPRFWYPISMFLEDRTSARFEKKDGEELKSPDQIQVSVFDSTWKDTLFRNAGFYI